MSELSSFKCQAGAFRRRLLATASIFTLATIIVSNGEATASEKEQQPTVWIEIGGQLESIELERDKFTAPFLSGPQTPAPFPFGHRYAFGPPVRVAAPSAPFDPSQPLQAQEPPQNSVGGEAKITFTPRDTDWTFSASLRYGRSNGNKGAHQATASRVSYVPNTRTHPSPVTPDIVRFSDAAANYKESHVLLDFQVGKDVGLGVFGGRSSSSINFGVRFAQFTSGSDVTIKADPYFQLYAHRSNSLIGVKYHFATRFHTYALTGTSERSFEGVGPSVSWSSSIPLLGSPDAGEFVVDWGANAALLFGRQRATVEHRTNAYDRYHTAQLGYDDRLVQYRHGASHVRDKSLVSPNLGGFAGFSLKFPGAKVSLGYRADFFFDVMDAGIDARHTQDVNFHGPFGTISIGLGG